MALHHSLSGDTQACGRLLFGAYESGWIAADEYRQRMARLYACAGRSGDDLAADLERWRMPAQNRQNPQLAKCRKDLSGKRFIVADDRLRTAGWDQFWEAVSKACGARLAVFDSAAGAAAFFKGDGPAVGDIAVLDLDFGAEGKHRGAELLREIRGGTGRRLLTLPVVVFTGATDPYLPQEARKAGADFVFFKQIDTSEPERARRYFEALVDTLAQTARLSGLHALWWQIVQLQTEMKGAVANDLARLCVSFLEKAFFFLAYGEADPRFVLMHKHRDGVFAESLLNSTKATEVLVDAEYQRLSEQQSKDVARRSRQAFGGEGKSKRRANTPDVHTALGPEDSAAQSVLTHKQHKTFRDRLGYVARATKSQGLRTLAKEVEEIWPRRGIAAHGRRGVITETHAREMLGRALGMLEAYASVVRRENGLGPAS